MVRTFSTKQWFSTWGEFDNIWKHFWLSQQGGGTASNGQRPVLVCACVCSVAQLCVTLCGLMDCSPRGSSVHGILQARILEWVAISSSRETSWPRDQTSTSWVSCIAGRFFTSGPSGKPYYCAYHVITDMNEGKNCSRAMFRVKISGHPRS